LTPVESPSFGEIELSQDFEIQGRLTRWQRLSDRRLGSPQFATAIAMVAIRVCAKEVQS